MTEITTLIPTFRRPKLLHRAVNSVLNQTYKEIQIYIFDNASGDETRKIVERMRRDDSRIHYVSRQENIGLIQNFSRSVEVINTPFFHFFSDDDYLFPWFYETALRGFKNHPKAGTSCCRTLIVDEKGYLLPHQFPYNSFEGYFPPVEGILQMLQSKNAWTGMIFRQDVMHSIGGLNTHVGSLFDIEFLIKASARFPLIANNKPCALFFLWNQSHSKSKQGTSFAHITRVLDNISHELRVHSKTYTEISARLYANLHTEQRGIWIHAIRNKDRALALISKDRLLQLNKKKEAFFLNIILWGIRYIPLFSNMVRMGLNAFLFFRKACKELLQNYYASRDAGVKTVSSSLEEIFSNSAKTSPK